MKKRIDLFEETFQTIMSNYDYEECIYRVHKGQFDPYDIMEVFLPQIFSDLHVFLCSTEMLESDEGTFCAIVAVEEYQNIVLTAYVLYDADFDFE